MDITRVVTDAWHLAIPLPRIASLQPACYTHVTRGFLLSEQFHTESQNKLRNPV